MDIVPFQNAEEDQGTHAQHSCDRVMDAVKSFGQPGQEREADDDEGLFLHGGPATEAFIKIRELELGIRPEHEINDENGRRHGENGRGHGKLNPVKKADLHAGEFVKKGGGDHAPPASYERPHSPA